MLRICAKSSSSYIKIDDTFEYDLINRILLKDNIPYQLSSTQKKFLYLLIKNKNSLVTFGMIKDYAWNDKEISHGTILSTMRDIKKVMPKSMIKNIKGEGYIF